MVCAKLIDSQIWKDIVSIWQEVMANIRWIVRDGKSTRFWLDVWLPSSVVLVPSLSLPLLRDILDRKLVDYVNYLDGQKVEDLQHINPNWVLNEVLAYPRPSSILGSNSLVWGLCIIVGQSFYYHSLKDQTCLELEETLYDHYVYEEDLTGGS